MASFETPSLSLRHGLRIVSPPSVTMEQVLLEVGEQVGHVNISYASRMNKAVVVFLKDQRFVTQLIESGLELNDEFLTVSGVPPFVPNEALEKELKLFGKAQFPLSPVTAAPRSPELIGNTIINESISTGNVSAACQQRLSSGSRAAALSIYF